MSESDTMPRAEPESRYLTVRPQPRIPCRRKIDWSRTSAGFTLLRMRFTPLHFRVGIVSVFVAVVSAVASTYQNPVRAGDFPDPSVIRVGDDYWATPTSPARAPHFPILNHRDSGNWERRGH